MAILCALELMPFTHVKEDLSCWNDTCVARGLCTMVPSALRARVLGMTHEGHLGIVKFNQRCRDLMLWPGIDRDIKAMVKGLCRLPGQWQNRLSSPASPAPAHLANQAMETCPIRHLW